jgi:hypothetical protein
LVLASLAAGFGVATVWHHQRAKAAVTAASEVETQVELSPATLTILRRLEVPVELEVYSLISPADPPEGAAALAKKVIRYVAAIETAGAGRVKVRLEEGFSAAGTGAARGAGLEPMDPDKSEHSYLGLSAKAPGRREVLARIVPEWELAFEADVARLLERAGKAPFVQRPPADLAVERAAAESVKTAIVDPEKVPLEEGLKILREAAQKRFETAVKAMRAQLAEAQQKVLEAERSQSESARAAAMEELRKIQAAHAESLEALTHEAQAQIEAWTKAKSR